MLGRLRPGALDELGLAACVRDMADAWQRRHGVACGFRTEGDLDALGERVNIAAYRIVQECLTNVAKHSGARRASIRLRRAGDALNVSVEDDGRGADPAVRAGLGFLGMSERASALGGSLRLARGPLGGLRVEAVLPLGA
jgi:two-component system sensor histidine kinase UhpB